MNVRIEKELPKRRTTVRDTPVDWAKAKRDLLENPGMWVLMAENVHASTGDQLRRGNYASFPKGEVENYEFTSRKPEDADYGPRRTNVWGRYTEPKGGKR